MSAVERQHAAPGDAGDRTCQPAPGTFRGKDAADRHLSSDAGATPEALAPEQASKRKGRGGNEAPEELGRARLLPAVSQTLIALSPEDLEVIVARAVRRALNAAADDGMISQAGSPLGPRRHADAVKRRLAAGLPGAAKVGRRYLLSPDALTEELSRTSAATACGGAAHPLADDPGAKLRRELGL
jgi:hypothetical protein